MGQNARNPVKATEMTFVVLDGLKELNGVGVTELAAHLDIPKSTVHSYLSTLEQEEFVVKEDGAYHVGVRFLEYGAHARKRKDIYEIAKPEIDRLAEETGNLSNLLIEEHGRGVYLHRGEGNRAIQVNAQVGTRVYLHSTALGKAILANLSEETVDGIIDRHGLPRITPNTITDRDELAEELGTIRERGYAIDDEERVEGLRCISAPVLSNTDTVVGSISVSGPTHRFKGEYFIEDIPGKVMEAANVIELNLTYS
ncbi:MAG: IclR family transcriptional regulator [Natronomonas sp.]|uniref:IclR family transcriptional regulator n=1 Tax=Natronomonas sp. TaxID=2184060 RepID=UPI00287056CE|nr:IclR family transcriptional regulator [Natronomonas sp.]MDR9429399.1 IclR family transcriptional regulator [Natronomonas sp.]